ncbi:2,3-dihydroxybenzoate-AMP ligase [Streptomyces sp. CB02923]|uniref:(2,3-dihydroxybenzoyl)adenylate synthase n=1 Tax=Streptomyces sp. CB02923 TaxID=1718985 RepID=UPI0009401ADD|nr:AMP-binding protein [Streptomyces sp. CB02923]OKH99757.1 2,3-dihydroxybenzoate-AMP ligase [Streptomyces sp. CB02923]
MTDDIVRVPAERAEEYRRRGWWQPLLVTDVALGTAREHPDRCAVVDGDRRLTYGELAAAVETAAARLRRLGIGRGDHVLVQLPNSLEYVVTTLALIRLGAPPVVALPALREHELDHVIRVTRPVAMAVPRRVRRFDHLAMAERLRERHPGIRTLLVTRDDRDEADETVRTRPDLADLTALALGGVLPGVAAPDLGPEPAATGAPEPPGPRDNALFLLSSGTTGPPKAIPRPHEAFGHVIRSAAEVSGLSASSVYLAVLPAAHSFVFGHPGILGTLSRGGRIVLDSPDDPRRTMALIEREGVTHCALAPAVLLQWLAAAEERQHDLTSLEVLQVGGARLDATTARRARDHLGCRVQQVYGMSEGLLNFTRLDDPEPVVDETQGRPSAAGDELRVVDGSGREVAAGETGELLTRGPSVLAGYYGEDEDNARAFTVDGYYRTGDLVRLHPSGGLVVAGRVKDVINRGGEKIPADELEALVLTHPGIRAAAAVAMPHPLYGEAVCVFAVGADDRAPTLRELRRFLEDEGLARYKLPERLVPVEALPLAGVGKVDKVALRAEAARLGTAGRTAR